MTPKEFTEAFTPLFRRRPFRPFEVVWINGERVTIDEPTAVAYSPGGSGAGFIAADGSIHFLDCEGVREILDSSNGAAP